jgi:hypothetical protein
MGWVSVLRAARLSSGASSTKAQWRAGMALERALNVGGERPPGF